MREVIRIGDRTACTDPAVQGSPDYFANGIPVHRLGDDTGGHGSWVPNYALTGSPDGFANGQPIVRRGDLHLGHASPTPNPFHQTAYLPGSPDHYLN